MLIRRALRDPAATEALGAELAVHVQPGTRIFLQGALGSGKTTFVRGFLRALGHSGSVKSPSFALLESYALSPAPVFHFDLYRLRSPAELESIGFREYFDGTGICLVEWPEQGGGLIGQPDLRVALHYEPDGTRAALLGAGSPRGERLLEKLRKGQATDR